MTEAGFPRRFIALQEAIHIHDDLLPRYGGMPGIRSRHGLESAVAAPQAAVYEGYLHSFPWGMAAAYVFHIIRGHPFMDGNKRTAMECAVNFLKFHGVELDLPPDESYRFAFRVAEKEFNEAEIAAFLKARRRAASAKF